MTWLDFKTAVRVYLVVHGRRQGIQTLIDALIKSAVWDLQASIIEYRQGFSREFGSLDLAPAGFAATGFLPPGSTITAATNHDPVDASIVYPYAFASAVQDILNMQLGLTMQGVRQISYVPRTGQFFVVPSPIDDNSWVTLTYDTKMTDFFDDDEVPFDDRAVEAASDYVSARLARTVDHDMQAAQSYVSSYMAAKRTIYSENNEAALIPSRAKHA